ncbi:MAG: hypothetical protein J6R18_06805 [Kiritimatiellae bacterium]|nr:hypothetical protein [Kiritimatiellia bacterium]
MVKHVILWKLKDGIAGKAVHRRPAYVGVANAGVCPYAQMRLCLNFEV